MSSSSCCCRAKCSAARRGGRAALVDDSGQAREDYDPGESITIARGGLAANRIHDVTVLEGQQPRFVSSLLSNARGEIEPKVLWPQFRCIDLVSGERLTVQQAQQR